MSEPDSRVTDATPNARSAGVEGKTFLLLLIVVTLGFGWILWPYYGAVFWGGVLAILFAPLFRRLLARMRQHRTLAALTTLAVILLIVILPLALIAGSLVREGAGVYERIRSGELNFGVYFEKIVSLMPGWLTQLLDRFGLGNIASLQQKLTDAVTQGSQFIATQAFGIGQNTLDFVVSFFITLYLAFFLLRDGAALTRRIREAIPLDDRYKRELLAKFTTVIRATVKGNVLVAAAQGALGGLAFWFLDVHAALLWALLMAFLSLLPAIGAGLIWLPVALYFLASGALLKGFMLIGYGVLVIGLVDNVLRPVLVGKDTKMPDYVVLISTLGGITVFGLNGFVIGPVIAAMFIAVWTIFASDRQRSLSPRPDDQA